MFKKLFGQKDVNEREEESFEIVDPVIEQRRIEKFSTPLIYDDEEVFEDDSDKTENLQETKNETEKKENKTTVKKQTKKPLLDQPYVMSEIISPMHGVQEKKKTTVKATPVVSKKPKTDNKGLIQIISPFFGNDIEHHESEEVVAEKEPVVFKEESVENNLRNIKSIVEEEQDQLKIIEQRTGEFKLDFSTAEDSLIDEIDDSMSLDELMNLYEKKFKD